MTEMVMALVLGLVGSLHCAGMCGPIALAIPLGGRSWGGKVAGGLLYNTGRTVTYVLLGLIFGLAGMGISLGGMQQWASIGIGILMILSVLVPGLARRTGMQAAWFNRMAEPLRSAFGRMFRLRSFGSLWTIGILNGFLPCGLVYIALAGALVTGDPIYGAAYMFFFGLGTIPMLMGISLGSDLVVSRFRKELSRIIPWLIVILGLIFILRGMNLGIPCLSPEIKSSGHGATMECCGKNGP